MDSIEGQVELMVVTVKDWRGMVALAGFESLMEVAEWITMERNLQYGNQIEHN